MESLLIAKFAALESELECIDDRVDELYQLANALEAQADLTQEFALEADKVLLGTVVLETYFQEITLAQKHQLALEELSAGMVAAIVAGFTALVAVIVKLVNWLRAGTSTGMGRAPENQEQLKAVQEILGDKELEIAVEDAVRMAEEAKQRAALEEFRHPEGITAEDVFDRFRQSLTEPEIDFLTSGQRYKVIKETVDDFTRHRFAAFVKGIGDDVTHWYEEALKAAPFIGRGEDVVQRFVYKEQRKLSDIRSRYSGKLSDIEEMEHRVQLHPPKGDHKHLQYFRSKPSALFPHLTHLWKSIRFDQMTEEDRQLIASLERIKHKFEETTRHIRGKSEATEKPWPAETEVLRLAHQIHRDLVKHLTALVKVGVFIKHSSNTAFEATLKSFSYLQRLLNVISKMPGVDQNRLHRCIDTLHRKRNQLTAVVSI